MFTRFIIFFLFLVVTLQCQANQSESLYWYPSYLQSEGGGNELVLKSTFTALPQSHGHEVATQANAFNGSVEITAQPGQHFTVCAGQVESDSRISAVSISGSLSRFNLVMGTGKESLSINEGKTCPELLPSDHIYHFRRFLYSEESFVVKIKEKNRRLNDINEPNVSGWSDTRQKTDRPVLLTDSGGGFVDTDDKRPGYFPSPFNTDSGDLSLTLLPVLRLPQEWSSYLPGSHWFHWLIGEPDYSSGITLLLRF